MSDDLYDVIVIGAGPAGSTAAIFLLRQGHHVALVDRAVSPRKALGLAWVSAKIGPFLAEMKIPSKALLDCPFEDVTLCSADFARQARPRFDSPAGYLVDRTRFDDALTQAAVKRGADLHEGSAVTDIRLKESSVGLVLADRRRLCGKLLVLASGGGSELPEHVGFAQYPSDSPIWAAQVEASLEPGAVTAAPRVAVILGLDGGGSFGLCCVSPEHTAVAVNWRGEPEEVVPLLIKLCRAAFEKGVVPVDLSEHAVGAKIVRSPAAAALDMDTHVAKHTLLIGDAGGFISAASNEGIYPAMWSAKLAAGAVGAALGTTYSQDELMTFDSLWRMEMADHLRSPHTDIRFLLPLVFSNQPMADRMGAAFFYGENF